MSFIKPLLKHLLAVILYYTGLVHLLGSPPKPGEAFILMYHRVVRAVEKRTEAWEQVESQPGIIVTEEFFDRQLEYISGKYEVVALESIWLASPGEDRNQRAKIVITFDDGWRDNFEFAARILQKHKLPATIFLTTDFISQSSLPWPEVFKESLQLAQTAERRSAAVRVLAEHLQDDLGSLTLRGYSGESELTDAQIDICIERIKDLDADSRTKLLTAVAAAAGSHLESTITERIMMQWDEVKKLAQAGLSFGGHGKTHSLLDKVSGSLLRQEIERSSEVIREMLDDGRFPFAYPNGNFNDQVKQIVKSAGYSCAVTTQRGVVSSESDLFELPRLNVNDGCCRGVLGSFSQAMFACYLAGVFDRS